MKKEEVWTKSEQRRIIRMKGGNERKEGKRIHEEVRNKEIGQKEMRM